MTFDGHRRDVAPYYAAADVFVLPSHSEGSPNALLEAMAARLPIVATRVGGVPEILTHEDTGILTAPRDPAALAEGLERLLRDADIQRSLGERAHAHAVTKFSQDAYRRTLSSIYTEFMNQRPDARLRHHSALQ